MTDVIARPSATVRCQHCAYRVRMTADTGREVGDALLRIITTHTIEAHPGHTPSVVLDTDEDDHV